MTEINYDKQPCGGSSRNTLPVLSRTNNPLISSAVGLLKYELDLDNLKNNMAIQVRMFIAGMHDRERMIEAYKRLFPFLKTRKWEG